MPLRTGPSAEVDSARGYGVLRMAIASPTGFILRMRTFLVGVYGDPSGTAALAFTQRLAGGSAHVSRRGPMCGPSRNWRRWRTVDLIARRRGARCRGAAARARRARSCSCRPGLRRPGDPLHRCRLRRTARIASRALRRRGAGQGTRCRPGRDACRRSRGVGPRRSRPASHRCAFPGSRSARGAQLLVGAPGPALAAAAAHVDLLVMGSQGHGRLRSALLGSVSRELIEDGCCPVLLTTRTTLAMPVRPLLSDEEGRQPGG